MNRDYPRVLFITPAAFNRVTGGGITFSSLFAGWPPDRLACVHDDDVPTSDDVCHQYYRLGSDEIIRLRRSGSAPPAAAPSVPRPPSGWIRRCKTAIFGDGLPQWGRLSPGLERWISDFRPQVIYTILGPNSLMDVIDAVQTRFDLPVVVHFMDDWPSAIYRGGLLSFIERHRMNRLLARLVERASARLAICDAMASAYERRWRQPFAAIQHTVDVDRWLGLGRPDSAAGFTVLYTGSILGFAQADSLLACAHAVLALRRRNLDVRLEILAPEFQLAGFRQRLPQHEAIRIGPTIADDDVYFRRLAAADLLLLPVNFDSHSQRYIGLSMPTKVPSYLVSGTPVLVYGPAGLAQVDYARQAGWGLVCDQPDEAALTQAMERALIDPEVREDLVSHARRSAKRHDSRSVRGVFQDTLRAAAQRKCHERS